MYFQVPFRAKNSMVDFQRYPWNLYLITNVENNVVFLTQSFVFCEFLQCFLNAKNAQVTLAETKSDKVY